MSIAIMEAIWDAHFEGEDLGRWRLSERQRRSLARQRGAVLAYRAMAPEERAELHAWEAANVGSGGDKSTMDWPGWDRYVEPEPALPPPTTRPLRQPKTPIPNKLRWAVWERDDFTCRGCGTRRNLSVDHVIPESAGGPTELANLQTLCVPCNSAKGTRPWSGSN